MADGAQTKRRAVYRARREVAGSVGSTGVYTFQPPEYEKYCAV
jgi:hypothetical protein